MSGLDEILKIIDEQQKETEINIMRAAEKRIQEINEDAMVKAERAYIDYIQRAKTESEHEFLTSCTSVDSTFRRKLLEYKVGCIDSAVEAAVDKLRKLPDKEYFEMILRLIKHHLRDETGVVSFSRKDLDRMPADLKDKLSEEAAKAGGSISVSSEPADINDGFILTYGNISENCSFSAVVESERESVRDTAAKALFGQVSK